MREDLRQARYRYYDSDKMFVVMAPGNVYAATSERETIAIEFTRLMNRESTLSVLLFHLNSADPLQSRYGRERLDGFLGRANGYHEFAQTSSSADPTLYRCNDIAARCIAQGFYIGQAQVYEHMQGERGAELVTMHLAKAVDWCIERFLRAQYLKALRESHPIDVRIGERYKQQGPVGDVKPATINEQERQ